MALLPSAPAWVLAPVWLALGVWAIGVRDKTAPPQWLSFALTLRLLTSALFVAIVGHWSLNRLLEAPFEWGWWTSATWATCACVVTYPKRIWNPLDAYREADWRWSATVALVLALATVGAQTVQYRQMVNRIAASDQPFEAAELAFRAGYLSLGVEASVLEARRLLALGEWPEAVRFIRSQWRQADRALFLRRFQREPEERLNPFFMLVCFGGQFGLPVDERAVDFDFDGDRQRIWLLTSEGRIVCVHANGWEERRWETKAPRKISVSARSGKLAVLDSERILLGEYDATPIHLPFPRGNDYVDLLFSEDGAVIWTLERGGQIDHYARQEDGGWIFNGNLMLRMWKEPIGQALLRSLDGDGFIVMDRFGGADLRTSSIDLRHLSPFRDLNRPEAQAMSVDARNRYLLLMDRFGRIDFADLAYTPREDRRTAQARHSIPAELDFDAGRGAWFWHEGAVALRMIPEIDSILTLRERGFFEAIVMPSGTRLHYRRRPFVVNR